MGWIILIVLIVLVLIVIGMYNQLVRLRAACESAWADIDVQLKRRYDLIPNLVEAVVQGLRRA
ncbi:MAG: LemA family protein [Nitrospiraceae bacterium]